MILKVKKRDGSIEDFNKDKIVKAVLNAFKSKGWDVTKSTTVNNANNIVEEALSSLILDDSNVGVEEIQDAVERALMHSHFCDVAKAYILYREQHKNIRVIKDRVDWIDSYINSSDNAASSSETDANANVGIKNVANIDGEVYKSLNRLIQRYRMTKKLKVLYSEVAEQYVKDLESHIIYCQDEASSPAVKNYCQAVSLYPLSFEGTKGMDGLGTTPPNNLSSFCGQLVNLTFLLSAQCKGAVAFGEFFNFLDHFCAKDFGVNYHINADTTIASILPKRTVKEAIHQAYQQIVYGWNQPAGNRSYQSPLM